MDNFLTGRPSISLDKGIQGVVESKRVGEAILTAEKLEESPLKSLNEERKVLKPEQSDNDGASARVETVYEGRVLRKIIVHCGCGKELVFECSYEA